MGTLDAEKLYGVRNRSLLFVFVQCDLGEFGANFNCQQLDCDNNDCMEGSCVAEPLSCPAGKWRCDDGAWCARSFCSHLQTL